MKNNEICGYINSKEVRNYLLNTAYTFSSVEAAWLVDNAYDLPLDMKLKAWNSIIDSMTDCRFDYPTFSFESFNSALQEYIILQERSLSALYVNSCNEYYEFVLSRERTNNGLTSWDHETHGPFTSYEACLSLMLEKYIDPVKQDYKLFIRKCSKNQPYPCEIVAYFSSKGEIVSLSFDKGEEPLLMDIFFWSDISLPTPFKKGDILYNPFDPSYLGGPIVIDNVPSISKSKFSDTSPFSSEPSGYRLFPDDNGYRLAKQFCGPMPDYEFYPLEKINGKLQIYKTLSDYLRNKIGLCEFANDYHNILLEEASHT